MVAEAQSSSSLQQLLEECRKEYERTQTELKEIDLLIQQTAGEVDRLSQRNAQATNRLRHVESLFDTMPREDIREAYTAVLEVQQRLFTMRGQLEKLQSDQRNLEAHVRLLRRVLELSQEEASLLEQAEGEGEIVPTVVRVIEAQERERKRMARQIHDGPAQALTNLVLQAEICERLFDSDPERARAELSNLKAAVAATFQRVRTFISDLRPMMLDDLGLVPTMRRYVEGFSEGDGVRVNLVVTGRERRIASYKEVTVFRIVQEILGKARDISHATSVQVTLDIGDDRVHVAVEDDGSGFEMKELTDGPMAEAMGLDTLRERVEMLGGWLQVESDPGRGTRVVFDIPLP
ncbi:MAG TPA: sensor histidine kinase [Anaerolineae bacterium]|nr:sensor histidine kinase [Anaerolineae bacterium]